MESEGEHQPLFLTTLSPMAPAGEEHGDRMRIFLLSLFLYHLPRYLLGALCHFRDRPKRRAKVSLPRAAIARTLFGKWTECISP